MSSLFVDALTAPPSDQGWSAPADRITEAPPSIPRAAAPPAPEPPVPHKARVVIGNDSVRFSLEAMFAVFDPAEARALGREFQERRNAILSGILSATRDEFLDGPQFETVSRMRQSLVGLGRELERAEAELARARLEYNAKLLGGDAVNGWSRVEESRLRAEPLREAYARFEQEVAAAEKGAEKQLRARIEEALIRYRVDGRRRYIEVVNAMVDACRPLFADLALSESMALQGVTGHTTGGALGLSAEQIEYGALPARPPLPPAAAAALAAARNQQLPSGPSVQFGPGPVTYPGAPVQFGPTPVASVPSQTAPPAATRRDLPRPAEPATMPATFGPSVSEPVRTEFTDDPGPGRPEGV